MTADSSGFEAYNNSELYQACQSAGISALPTEPRVRLIRYLEGETLPDATATNEWDQWRHGLMGFILEWWAKLEPQLTCPARSGDPLSCFRCVDAQVAFCVTNNKTYEKHIRIHLPKETRK